MAFRCDRCQRQNPAFVLRLTDQAGTATALRMDLCDWCAATVVKHAAPADRRSA